MMLLKAEGGLGTLKAQIDKYFHEKIWIKEQVLSFEA